MSAALVADIGGSKSRFGLVNATGLPERVVVIENDTVPDLETAVTRYLKDTGARPQAAVMAIAGPIQGEEITLTNRAWAFRLISTGALSADEMAQQRGLPGATRQTSPSFFIQ